MRHNSTNLLKCMCEINKKLSIDPILNWEIIKKKFVNIRQVIDFANCVWRRN